MSIAAFILIERASLGFRSLKPEIVTVYDPAFWRVERYWKLSDSPHTTLFNGTPMRNVIRACAASRSASGCSTTGASCRSARWSRSATRPTSTKSSIVQSHSLEEGVFKSDVVRIGAGASIGIGCLVHYGVTMGDDTHLDADSFLMKGEITPVGSRWRGNPAKLVHQGT